MKQKITVDGVDREIDLPDDATPDEIDEIVNQEMSGTPDAAPEPTPEPAKPSIMDKALDAGFPLSRSISRSMKPGIGRDLLANAGTALDVLSAPFRAIDAGINEISKPVNKLTGVSGSYEEGKQAIAGMIPGKGVVSNLARTGVDMALSPSSYVPAGAIGKMMRTPVQKVESEMAKQLSMKTPRAAPAAIPQKTEDMTLKEVEKGGGPIEQATGEVIDASKVPQQGLPMLRDLSESERRIMSEPKAPNTIPFSEYAKQSVLKKKNVQAAQPNQLAATNASKAFEEVDMMRKDAGKKLQEVIDANPDAVIDISSAKQEYLQMVNDRIQPMIKGEIAADPSAVKLSEEIGNMLLNLPDQISAKVGVNLKRNLQNRVKYDAEGQLRPVNGLLEGITKATAGSIDGSLDKALKGFKEANEAYGKTSQLRNNMSKVLGKEISETTGLTKHGASIMKRAIESNADSGISELFRQVKEMTGGKYDLFQDASYASIAMKHSGDVRQVQMALPFGGALTAAMGHPTGILDIAKKSGEAIGAIRGGNQLARIDKWHTKQQAKNPGSTVADFAAKKTPVDQSKLSDQVKPGQSVADFVAESQKKGATPAGKKTGTMADRLRTIGADAARRLGNERGQIGAYHGSPHSFDKFGPLGDVVGTGEGHQAFGHGLYFTSEKDIAKHYADKLASNIQPSKDLLKEYFAPGRIVKGYGGNDKVIAFNEGKDGAWSVTVQAVDSKGNPKSGLDGRMREHRTLPSEKELRESLGQGMGRMYTVTLHKGKTPGEYDYLKWDEPVSDASLGKISKALEEVRPDMVKTMKDFNRYDPFSANATIGERHFDTETMAPTGSGLYKRISKALGSDKAASDFLLKAGIDGIDYPAGSLSGGASSKARNYVVFDPNAVTIESREAGSGAVPMMAGMAAAGVGGATGYHAFMKKREQARNKKK